MQIARIRDRGAPMIVLFVGIALLGALTILVLALEHDRSRDQARSQLPHTASQDIGAVPRAARADTNAASIELCRSSGAAVQEAVSQYEALNGRTPTSMSDLGGVLTTPVRNSRFTILIGPSAEVFVSTPTRPPAPGVANCAYA